MGTDEVRHQGRRRGGSGGVEEGGSERVAGVVSGLARPKVYVSSLGVSGSRKAASLSVVFIMSSMTVRGGPSYSYSNSSSGTAHSVTPKQPSHSLRHRSSAAPRSIEEIMRDADRRRPSFHRRQ